MAVSPVLRQKLREVEKLRQGHRATIKGEPGIDGGPWAQAHALSHALGPPVCTGPLAVFQGILGGIVTCGLRGHTQGKPDFKH